MRKMKDSGIEWIGVVPKNWEIERLQWHLYEIVEKNDPIQTTQVLSLTNKKGVIPYEEKGNQGNTAKENYDGYKIAYPDTIVANSMNILIGSVGYSKLYGCVSPVYYVFKEKNNNDLRFINYIMQTSQFQCELRKCANGILEIRLRVSSSDILKQKCAFPNLQTQTLIADYLDEKCAKIDKIIEKQQAVIEKLKEYKLSVITEAVTKGLNPDVEMRDSGIEWIETMPVHWKSIKLKYCTYIRARLGWKGLKADEYVEKGYPLLSAFNIVNSKLDFENNINYINEFRYDESPEIKLSINDILLVKDGAGIGKCAIVEQLPLPSTTNGSLAVITTDDKLSAKFLYYFFLSNVFQKYIDRIKDGMGVPHLFQSDLREIAVVVPSISEQNLIVTKLNEITERLDISIQKKEKIIEKLQAYKKSLIYEVVTGKKVV